MVVIQFGLETEIGITRENADNIDVVSESIALVRSTTAPGVRMCWDYRCEDPHRDARGFRVAELLQDTDEANYFAQDSGRALSYAEIKSDFALRSGGRFYNDHAHPEYCTPECGTLMEILQQDYAGDRFLMACCANVNQKSENPMLLYKNNTDFRGHSYGCHENYLFPRDVPWEVLSEALQAFFVTRQIICGSGKFGWEEEDRFLEPGFQISQRSDFFKELQSVDTMQRRPLINTRDEPHANPERFRRFHVIVGDSNMSLFATYLKIGTTAMVLQSLLNGAPLSAFPRLENPLESLKEISRDLSWKWECRTVEQKTTNAVEVQRRYLQLAREYAAGLTPEWKQLLYDWDQVLADLERDPLSTANRLDWPAKYKLIEQFREAEKLDPTDPWLRSLDLAYHHLNREQGLFYGLMDQGAFESPFPLDAIKCHGLCPPLTTRAAVRGYSIEKFGGAVVAAQWDHLMLRIEGDRKIKLDLRDLFDTKVINESLHVISAAQKVEDLLKLPFAKLMD